MTKIEQAELNELVAAATTPEQLEQRRREVEGRRGDHAEPNGIEPARQRKTRSDKGATRVPKMVTDVVAADLPAPPGAITKQQAAQLVRLAEIMCASHQKLDEARRENHQALHDYCKYVESLTTN